MRNDQLARRRFLGGLLAAAGTTATPFAMNMAAMGAAAAATANDYKALVCLFLTGGNDHYNTLLATDPSSWQEYRRLRDTQDGGSIALAAPGAAYGVLPIVPSTPQSGRSFALHPQLGPLKTLFDAGRLAAVANVGTLVVPTTKAQYQARTVPLPPKLFSHNDQQAVWQSSHAEGAGVGWGGRLGDLLAASNANASLTCISTSGNALFLSGQTVTQYQMSAAGAVPIQGIGGRVFGGSAPLQQIVSGPQSTLLQAAHGGVVGRAIDLQATLAGAVVPAGAGGVPDPSRYTHPVSGASLVNPLAVQLQTVARVIAGRSALGARRQVFYVSLSTFDTHDNQAARHADMMARLAHAMAYFDTQMGNLLGTNLRNQVTLFTASDFGRTLTSNGDGTDHGWGAHHFVAGGAVKGRNIYGAFPTIGLGHALDVGQGALVPTIAAEQYAATLGTWFGVPASQLPLAFPNLANFNTGNLGFMT